MRRGCGCNRLGADLPAVWKGNPLELILRVATYWVPDWWAKLGIPNMDHAAKIVGKWAYYLQKGSYPDTAQGRKTASTPIANDVFRDVGVRYSPDSVYSLLQNAFAYLQKDSKTPANQKPRGTLLQAMNPLTGLRQVKAEAGDRWTDQKTEFKKSLGILANPWALGGLAVVSLGVIAGIRTRIGGR